MYILRITYIFLSFETAVMGSDPSLYIEPIKGSLNIGPGGIPEGLNDTKL